jgi:hypothetical protein
MEDYRDPHYPVWQSKGTEPVTAPMVSSSEIRWLKNA